MNILGIGVPLLIFIVGYLLIIYIGQKLKVKPLRSLAIYFWHTLFCVYYYFWASSTFLDANFYYDNGLKGICDFGPGTRFINSISCTLIFLNISFLGSFLIFNIIGSIGLLLLNSVLNGINNTKRAFPFFIVIAIVFLPSASVWSAALGKDALFFLASCLLLWSMINISARKVFAFFALALMAMIRPHIAILALISVFAGVVGSGKLPTIQKYIIIAACAIGSYFGFPFVLNFLGLNNLGSSAIGVEEFIVQRQSNMLTGGSGVDISEMGLVAKLFTYMFRPLPFEAHNLTSLVSSADNMVLLTLFLYFLFCLRLKILKYLFKYNFALYSFCIIYSSLSWVALSAVTSNLGIAARQKWMFAPMLLFVIFSVIVVHLRKKG